MSGTKRYIAARRLLAPLGITISERTESGRGGPYEYRVTFFNRFAKTGRKEMTTARCEALAYYTNDIDDAIATGRVMASQYRATSDTIARKGELK